MEHKFGGDGYKGVKLPTGTNHPNPLEYTDNPEALRTDTRIPVSAMAEEGLRSRGKLAGEEEGKQRKVRQSGQRTLGGARKLLGRRQKPGCHGLSHH